jgi:hypothetical protein
MNRFDKSFNDTDPITGRPFSSGHPDGVWIIAILYSIPVILATAFALFSLFFREDKSPIIAAAVVVIAYVPPIILLFRRSKIAVWWIAAISGICIFPAVKAYFLEPNMTVLIGALIALCYHGYMALFTLGLKKDELLK